MNDVELPGVLLDNVVEVAVSAALALINRDPDSGEVGVPQGTSVQLDIAALDAGNVDISATYVYVDGALAFGTGVVDAAFDGTGAGFSYPQADVLRVLLVPLAPFESETPVTVRVVTASTTGAAADLTYTFIIADTTAPRLQSAEALDTNRVRVTFSENVKQLEELVAASALTPSNWALARLGDYMTPVVSATVVGVEMVTTNSVDLLTNISLTPGGSYLATAAGLEDVVGNPVAPPHDTVAFTGWVPPRPADRIYDLYKLLPDKNRREDETGDLRRFVGCFQEVADLLLWDIDRWTDILDPDLAAESWVDAMLVDLGNPFNFDLSLADKRRLVQVLVDMYALKGTAVGIRNVVRFFMQLEVTIDPYNASNWEDGLVLGDSELGVDWILGTGNSFLLYSFEVSVGVMLTPTQEAQLRAIVEYMKPAHTHFVRLVQPIPPVVVDHLELGYSELGVNWQLH